jgi:hypothetical protein
LFRKIRIALLLMVFAHVAIGGWLLRARTASWDVPLRVAVFPIAADGSPRTREHVEGLAADRFEAIEAWFAEEGRRYGVRLVRPVDVQLAKPLLAIPPAPPFGGHALEIMFWSLQLRWWVWQHADTEGPAPHVKLFLVYHDPRLTSAVPHSVGLREGMVGVVHVYADRGQTAENLVVATHELLHTLGATDKYDPATNLPRFPDGYAEPGRGPGAAQDFAEIMAGRTPVSPGRAEMPSGLDATLIGTLTAREIGWVR